MEAYHAFAAVYDRMMDEIPYESWCDYVCGLLAAEGVSDGLLLELGCGTGTLTELFARRGFDMIGVDRAACKCWTLTEGFFLQAGQLPEPFSRNTAG